MATQNAINSQDPIQVALGGTGAATLLAHGILLGEGTGAITPMAVGSSGQIVVGASTADPSWVTPTAGSNMTVTTNSTTLSYALNSSPSVSGSLTAGTSITATSGNITITSGNLLLPTVTSSVGQIQVNAATVFHTYGTSNIFIGDSAGNFTLTTATATKNQCIGTSCGAALTIGTFNTFIGYQAGKAVTSGSNNVYLGNNVAQVTTTQSDNVCIGDSSGIALTTGTGNNVFIGGSSGGQITTGATNVLLGIACGFNLTGTDGQNIFIGQTRGTAGDNTTIRIGFSTTNTLILTRCFIDGIRGKTTTAADAINVLISSTGQLGTVSSSIRVKENVRFLGDTRVLDLRPVRFNYKSHPDRESTGLIAEEVFEIMPELVVNNAEGEIESIKYHELPVLLLAEIQKLAREVAWLKEQIMERDR